MKKLLLSFLLSLGACWPASSQSLYFPPLSSSAQWDTLSPDELGWCRNEVDSLYAYLQQENSKGFVVLKDGKIVLEKYFGFFTQDSLWYWASAGKTLTSFLIGKAQEENFLSLSDTSSKYLGQGWTNCSSTQENNIRIKHQLSMTSGLDDGVPDNHCTLDTCLNYLADPETRWAYHNAPYTLLEDVLSNATGSSMNVYTQTKLKTPTGMTGFWLSSGYNNVYYSNVRSMARFGLLAQNNFIWNGDTLIHDSIYAKNMVSSSQTLNPSYGYLWWLNGQSSFMVPTLQLSFPNSYAPQAPADMVAGIGKNGQIVSVSKSKGLVVVRMGNQSSSLEVPFLLVDNIWKRLNAVMCNLTSLEEKQIMYPQVSIFPNPASDVFSIDLPEGSETQVEIRDVSGALVMIYEQLQAIPITELSSGWYFVTVKQGKNTYVGKLIKH